jgi:hypothetical protein
VIKTPVATPIILWNGGSCRSPDPVGTRLHTANYAIALREGCSSEPFGI